MIKYYTSDDQVYFETDGEKPMNKEQKIQESTERIEKSQTELDELKEELEKLQKSNDKQRFKKIQKLIYEKQRIEALLDHGVENFTICDYFGRRRIYIRDFTNNLKEHISKAFEDRIEVINNELKELGVEM